MIEKGIIAGNVYPKYSTKNPVARHLMVGFLNTLDQLVASVDPSSIHEVGCGEGYVISRFATNNRILMASDFSDQVIQEARQLSLKSKINFKVASVYELTKEDSASLILCCEVMEHLEFPERALEVLSGIANPYLIASVPNEPLWRILNILRWKYLGRLGNTPGHLQHWSRNSFIHFLERRFEIINTKTPFPWTMVLCRTRN